MPEDRPTRGAIVLTLAVGALLLGSASSAALPRDASAPVSGDWGKNATKYRRAAGAICTGVRRDIEKLAQPKTKAAMIAYHEQALALSVRALARLRQLDPPARLAGLHARVVAVIDQENVLFRRYITRIRQSAGPAVIEAIEGELGGLHAAEDALWKKLGVPACVGD